MLHNKKINKFSAETFGVKRFLPAYRSNPEIEDLLTGVSFASGGAGYDDLTSKLAVYTYM